MRLLAIGLAAAPVGTGDVDQPGLLDEATQAGTAQATGMVMAALDVAAFDVAGADAVSRLRDRLNPPAVANSPLTSS